MPTQEPFLDKQALYVAREGGYTTYRIPSIVVTLRGTLLAYCEARKTARGDWGAIDILVRRSTDGGVTWAPPVQMNRVTVGIAKNPVALRQGLAGAADRTFNNPVPIVDRQSGAIHLLHCAEYARCFHMRSDDDGVTWSEPVEITTILKRFRAGYDWKVIATGPGHGIQLSNGRLLVPVWMSTGTGGYAHRPSCVSVIYSDDCGETWDRGEIVVRHDERTPNPSETAALELRDGRVMLNIRTESRRHRRLVCWSADGATRWSEPAFDESLFEPVCFASLTRLVAHPDDPRTRILFANPDSHSSPAGPNDWGAWPRENLTVRMSYDEGKSWPVSRVLDPGIAGYSDLAVGPRGTIYCLYEGGGIAGDMFHNACLALARFNLEWLAEGAEALEEEAARAVREKEPMSQDREARE